MNYSKYQLVVSDLDGTLIKYGSDEVSSAVKQAVRMLAGEGVSFMVATGRSWRADQADRPGTGPDFPGDRTVRSDCD